MPVQKGQAVRFAKCRGLAQRPPHQSVAGENSSIGVDRAHALPWRAKNRHDLAQSAAPCGPLALPQAAGR